MFGLTKYSDRVESRLTARHKYSLDLVRGLPVSKVLDVGSSFGWLESFLGSGERFQITAVELDPSNLAQARKNVPDGAFVAASVLSLPFADCSFDAAVMFEVLEHLPRGTEGKALSEISRVLRPGGAFILSTPYAHPVSTLTDPAWYFGHRHYSKRRLRTIFEAAGFQVQRMVVRGGPWEIAAMLLLYTFKWVLGAEMPFKNVVERQREREYLQSQLGWSTVFVEASKNDAT